MGQITDMLGKSSSFTSWVGAVALATGLTFAFSCQKNVKQDAHTGKDGRYKGAQKVELKENEAKVKGIVTYPGGDRVDWRMFTLPEGTRGKLRLKLSWQPPRPGLDLAFRVYDEYFERVDEAKPTPDSGKRRKSVTVNDAQGTYYVQIYAPRRMDAGKYNLSIQYKERGSVASGGDLLAEIKDPPKLPGIPEAAAEPVPGRNPDGTPIVPETPAEPEPSGPSEIKGKITKFQMTEGSGVIITINRGKKKGVQKGWRGVVLNNNSGEPMSNGEFKIIKVTSSESVGKVKMSIGDIKANRKVVLYAE